MPGLQSFCVTTAIGLGSIFLLQISWFAAWLSLDEKRIEAGRNGLIPCFHHNLEKLKLCTSSSLNPYEKMKEVYAKLVVSNFYKITVIIIGCTFVAFGIYGWIHMKQVFYLLSMLPSDSYLRKWYNYNAEYYPSGFGSEVYSGHINYMDLENIDKLGIVYDITYKNLNHMWFFKSSWISRSARRTEIHHRC